MSGAFADTGRIGWGRAASAWLPVLLYMAVIYFLSARPMLPEVPGPLVSWDKAQHAIAYLGLALVAFRASSIRPLTARLGVGAESSGLAALYGLSDEIHQMFVPGRSGELLDWAADLVGITLALACISLVRKLRMNGGR